MPLAPVSYLYRANPRALAAVRASGDRAVRASSDLCQCGQLRQAHARCADCGALIGPGHSTTIAVKGLCDACRSWAAYHGRGAGC